MLIQFQQNPVKAIDHLQYKLKFLQRSAGINSAIFIYFLPFQWFVQLVQLLGVVGRNVFASFVLHMLHPHAQAKHQI
jgi:hypothetical protein